MPDKPNLQNLFAEAMQVDVPGGHLPASPVQIWPHFGEYRTAQHLEIPSEARAEFLYRSAAHRGELTYGEVLSLAHSGAQAAAARKDSTALRQKLIQVAAAALHFARALERGETGL